MQYRATDLRRLNALLRAPGAGPAQVKIMAATCAAGELKKEFLRLAELFAGKFARGEYLRLVFTSAGKELGSFSPDGVLRATDLPPDPRQQAFRAAFAAAADSAEKAISGLEPGNRNKLRKFILSRAEFGVPAGKPLAAFTRLLNGAKSPGLEGSLKVRGPRVYASRFNLWFEKDEAAKMRGLADIFSFLGELEKLPGVKLDRSGFGKVIGKGLDFGRIWKIGVGTDFREKTAESRVKLWFYAKDYPELAEKAAVAAAAAGARTVLQGSGLPLLFGFYLGLDGSSEFRAYVSLGAAGGMKAAAAAGFPLAPRVKKLAARCSSFYASFGRRATVLNFFPADPRRFWPSLGIPALARLESRCAGTGYPLMGVSLREEDFLRGKAKDFNLYY